MAYRSINYKSNAKAPIGMWTCAPGSSLGPFDEVPEVADTKAPNYCGQCVSYVKQVCPSLPPTILWSQGAPVKGNTDISSGTVIATFNSAGKYWGHAAMYVSQDAAGIAVYDQYGAPPSPKEVGPRLLRFGASGDVNNGDKFYVVE